MVRWVVFELDACFATAMPSGVRIGLTGGMGCGKSTVAGLFRERGFGVLDSDAIVHDLLAEDSETIEAVRRSFGSEVILPSGGVDRKALGRIVFGSPEKLELLEGILHPKVRERWQGVSSDGGNWVIEIPLLFEKNLQKNVDVTVCVFCDPQKQASRLESRGLDRSQAAARIRRQMPLSEKASLADYVLLNDGSLEFLSEQLDRLISQTKTLL